MEWTNGWNGMDRMEWNGSLEKVGNGPRTVLICGVNGVGKTTTIGNWRISFITANIKKS